MLFFTGIWFPILGLLSWGNVHFKPKISVCFFHKLWYIVWTFYMIPFIGWSKKDVCVRRVLMKDKSNWALLSSSLRIKSQMKRKSYFKFYASFLRLLISPSYSEQRKSENCVRRYLKAFSLLTHPCNSSDRHYKRRGRPQFFDTLIFCLKMIDIYSASWSLYSPRPSPSIALVLNICESFRTASRNWYY